MATGNPVCNWNFYPPGTSVTPATGPEVANGSVTAGLFLGSGDPPKFVIYAEGSPIDPSYASPLRQSSATFTGLLPGNYVIDGRSSASCHKLLTITISYVYQWFPRWRIQHGDQDNNNVQVRIDIEDSNFLGSVSYVTAQDIPDELTWVNERQDDIFEPVIGSELMLNLIAETDGQFDDITSCYDERRFRATYYKKVGNSYVQFWQGFVIPQNGDEEYWSETMIPITVSFSDGLADLENVPFSDQYGNIPQTRISFLDGIVFCLYKTYLQIDIWETVGIYAVGMSSGPTYSTVNQAYFDPKVYLQEDGTMEDSLTVLRSLLLNLGARLVQCDGVWNIDCPTLKTASTVPTRKFNYLGGSPANFDQSPRIDLKANSLLGDKIIFEGLSARKSHQTMYGKLDFTYDFDLEEDQSIVDGDFEDEEVGSGQLKNWQVTINNSSVVTSSIQDIKRDGDSGTISSKVLQIGFDPIGTTPYSSDPSANIYSREIPYTFRDNSNSDPSSISFDVYVDTYSPDAIIFIDYLLIFDDGSTTTVLNDTDLVDSLYTRFYLEPKKWQTITHDNVIFPGGSKPVSGTIQIVFRVSGNLLYDYSSPAALAAVPTAGFSQDEVNRRKGIDNLKRVQTTIGGPVSILQMKLVSGDEATDGYNVIQPTDQAGGGPHQYIWKLDKVLTPVTTPAGLNPVWAKKVQLDNVRLKYLPDNGKPEGSVKKEYVMNSNVKNTLEHTFRHGDLPENTNYQNLTHGWISLSDDTPTSLWRYRVGDTMISFSLLDLLANMYQGQYSVDRWKLSASVVCAPSLPTLSKTIQEPKTGKVYVVVSSSLISIGPTAIIGIIESLQGTSGGGDVPEEPPISTRDFSPIDFDETDFYTQ